MEFHIHCDAKDVAGYAFVPGDHSRARRIADRLESVRMVNEHRGYLVFIGKIEGIPVTVSSTGMGGPPVAICMEELGHLGVHTFIRVGSCGTYQDYVDVGDVIVATGTYRWGGTSLHYLPIEFPAVPDYHVTKALVDSAKSLNIHVHTGLASASDAFYGPRDPTQRDLLRQAGLLAGEMESDTLFVVAARRGWRAGALFSCDGTSKQTKPEDREASFRKGEQDSISIAIEAMKQIALADARCHRG
jgi:uridine phosphorylase